MAPPVTCHIIQQLLYPNQASFYQLNKKIGKKIPNKVILHFVIGGVFKLFKENLFGAHQQKLMISQ